jgi:hypothetical protein
MKWQSPSTFRLWIKIRITLTKLVSIRRLRALPTTCLIYCQTYLSGARKRALYRELGLTKPTNRLASELPVIEIHPELRRDVCYARKLACALYYREQAYRLARASVLAYWGQVADPRFQAMASGWINMTPLIDIGRRTNIDFGDRFGCLNKADKPDVLPLSPVLVQAFIALLIADEETTMKIEKARHTEQHALAPPWIRVRDNYPLEREVGGA